jgi:hypothetical protein
MAAFSGGIMSFNLLLGLALAFLVVWTVTSYFFWRIQRANRLRVSQSPVHPALQLADQWLAESQRKMEELAGRMEQPLSAAQNELLELRLEAGRVPQGIKDLRLVRESLRGLSTPAASRRSAPEMARFYLAEGGFRAEGAGRLILETPLGPMPCLETGGGEGPLTEERMKEALSRIGPAPGPPANAVAGGFLYFPSEAQYQACLANPGWMEGLKSHRFMVLDPKGFSSLLMALRLWRDSQQVIRVFEAGVDSTRPLTGQSDRMGEALSALSADALKARTVLDGGVTEGFGRAEGGEP